MVHQLQVSLIDSKPKIWRSFKINSNSTFEELHLAIQVVMGWGNYHLYEFKNKEFTIGADLEEGAFSDNEIVLADNIKIIDVLPRKRSNIIYTYDFGDCWEHKITVEEIFKDELILSPICISGEMNCPPEDCGGSWGYSDLLKVIKNKKHPENAEMLEWLGGSFDPTDFNLNDVNKTLSQFKPMKKKIYN